MPETLAKTAGNAAGAPGLEAKFSGGWLVTVHEPGGDVEVVLGLGGGGLTVINATFVPTGAFHATGMGSWKPVGPREVAVSMLLFARDSTMNLLYYEKGLLSLTLGDQGNWLAGPAVIYVYLPGQDPLDPEEEPFLAVPVMVDARRIPAE